MDGEFVVEDAKLTERRGYGDALVLRAAPAPGKEMRSRPFVAAVEGKTSVWLTCMLCGGAMVLSGN